MAGSTVRDTKDTRAHGLPPMRVSRRLEDLRRRISGEDVDALLVSKQENIRYLTGFSGSSALVLVTEDQTVFVTDGRYGEQAEEQLAAAGVDASIHVRSRGQEEVLKDALRGARRLGLEAHHVTWAFQRRMATEWFPDLELVPCSGWVEDLRLRKDEGEVARIAAAAAIADAALERCLGLFLSEVTESEFALELETWMRRLGSEEPSFPTIVASGPNSAKPHAKPGDRRMREGDVVVVDFGATVDGYRSDMTRTFVLGDEPERVRRLRETVAAAQAAGVTAVRDGAAVEEVDRACRSIIEEAGLGEAFVHATGHGVGLEIHEEPRIASSSEGVLAAGMVVTVEPGVYLAGEAGVRIEDTLLVEPNGSRTLTGAPKDPHPRLGEGGHG